MTVRRVIAGGTAVALCAALVAVAPATGAPDFTQRAMVAKRAAPAPRGGAGFTPAAADPRLAAAFARAGLSGADGGFRFTPSETRQGNRSVTVAVRSRTNRNTGDVARAVASTGVAPIAYNLGVAVGWRRFAISGDVAKVDFAGQPGGRESADVAVSYSLDRFTGQVRASGDRALPGAPRLVDSDRGYALDVGGAFSLTRNVDLTAGVRYRTDRERLTRVADDRRDSQAVYVGTAFRF